MNDRHLFVFRTLGETDVPSYADKGFIHLGRVLTDAGLAVTAYHTPTPIPGESG